jgi:hypothetical protein
MTPDPVRRPRAARLLGGTLAAALVAALLVAGFLVWFFSFALPGRQAETGRVERESGRERAAAAAPVLAAAAGDGVLSDEEITAAVGRAWSSSATADAMTVRARFPVGPICYEYVVTLPLGPGARVAPRELPDCPEVTPR